MLSHSQAFISAIIVIYCLAIIQCVSCETPVDQSASIKIAIPDLPPSHYQFWLKNYPRAFNEFTNICSETKDPLNLTDLEYFRTLHANLTFDDPDYLSKLEHGRYVLNSICSKLDLVSKSCWGYENNCQLIHLMPECEKGVDEQENKIAWFSQADFGYILDRRREMNKYCSPDKYSNESVKSSLECTKFFRTCRGDNLMINFNTIPKEGSLIEPQVGQSVIKRGDIGGWNCDLQRKRIPEEDGQRGALESWFNELSNYDKLEHVSTGKCDLNIDKQAFIIKLDSPANLHHYLSSFLNLYATMHLNNRFSDDNQIIIWDNQSPRSKFDTLWNAFTRNPLKSIGDFEKKRVCFKKFIFTLTPRTVDGLFYNAKLTPSCFKSGLFDAFNKHVLHKLKIPQDTENKTVDKFTHCGAISVIRVTLSIRSTPHRQILNQAQLATAIKRKSNNYLVQLIDFQKQNFLDQLKIIHNTDILIGIHGAGLAHTLFLPDWAVLYELHDCQDNCYHDLARLRGVGYVSPKTDAGTQNFFRKVPVEDEKELRHLNTSNLLKYDQYWNFDFDEAEFLKLFDKAVEKVGRNRLDHFKNCSETKEYTISEKIKRDPLKKEIGKVSVPEDVKKEPAKREEATKREEPVKREEQTKTEEATKREEPMKRERLFRKKIRMGAKREGINKESTKRETKEDVPKGDTKQSVNQHTEL